MTRATLKTNRLLLIATAVLVLLSVWTYRHSVDRADRFERGQRFLANLNPDEITDIHIGRGGDDQLHLKRSADGKRFMVVSANGYRADTAAVNRLIQDVLGIELEKEIGSGDKLERKLGLAKASDDQAGEVGESPLQVRFGTGGERDLVRFLVGEAVDGGTGSYVVRDDAPERTIYLTSKRVFFETDDERLVDQQILDIERDRVAAIKGADFVFETVDGKLQLAGLDEEQSENAKAGQLRGLLDGLRFTEHHLVDAPEVQGLRFDQQLEYRLTDGSGYAVGVAERGEDHYLRVEGFHDQAGTLSIAVDADEDEVKATSEVLGRVNEIADFNAFHGSWIYQVTDVTADKVRLRRADLVE